MSDPISDAELAIARADRRDADRERVEATLGTTMVWLYGSLLLAVATILLFAVGWRASVAPLVCGVLLSPRALKALKRARAVRAANDSVVVAARAVSDGDRAPEVGSGE